jgi:membrane-bound metal-dependent hydrolase YbcI (DUF457 family)
MRPQAHVASSLLVWSASRDAALAEAPLCVLAGNLPDLDRNVAKRLGVKRRDHHRWVSHSLVGWLAPTALALALGRRNATVRRATALVWVHLLLDTYADGIAWLWPLREDKIGLFRKTPGIRDRGWRTPAPLSTELGKAELAMWVATALMAARR